MKTEKIRRALELINVIYAGDVYREALAELATLIDGCAWGDAAKEKIAALESANAAIREALQRLSDATNFDDDNASAMNEADSLLATLSSEPADEVAALEKQIAVKDEALSKAANLMELLQYETVSNKKKLEVWDAVKAALIPDSGKMLVDEDAAMKQKIAEANAVLSAKPIDEIASLKHGPDLLEKLREIEWAASSQKRGGGFACTCPACGGWLEDEHSQDCWLGNILKTAREKEE